MTIFGKYLHKDTSEKPPCDSVKKPLNCAKDVRNSRCTENAGSEAQDFSLEMQAVQCGSALLPVLKVEEATGFKGEDSRITINTFGRRGMQKWLQKD